MPKNEKIPSDEHARRRAQIEESLRRTREYYGLPANASISDISDAQGRAANAKRRAEEQRAKHMTPERERQVKAAQDRAAMLNKMSDNEKRALYAREAEEARQRAAIRLGLPEDAPVEEVREANVEAIKQQQQEEAAARAKPKDDFWFGQEAHAEQHPLYTRDQMRSMQQILKGLTPEYLYEMGILQRPNPELKQLSGLLGPRLSRVLGELSGRYGGGYGAPHGYQPNYGMMMNQRGPQDFPSYQNPYNQLYADTGSLLGSALGELGGLGIKKYYNR